MEKDILFLFFLIWDNVMLFILGWVCCDLYKKRKNFEIWKKEIMIYLKELKENEKR